MHNDSDMGTVGRPPVKATAARAPLLGLLSFAALPLGAAVAYGAQWANHGVTAGASTTGVSIGVLASAAVALLAALGSRVRQERWAWLGIVGAVLGAAPLALFIGSMLLHR
ncbi:hypothetical protein ACTUVK_001698 [Stenotrophomonas rhizophila]|uniref:Transmembrane protein n=1 Tax=Stenotrophomonas nematodicola TaxID=2656746 RepID=A0ABW7D0R9_9GAMM